MITAAHNHRDPLRHTHACDCAAAGERKLGVQRLWTLERCGTLLQWFVRITRTTRQNRAVANKSNKLAAVELTAQILLVTV